MPYLRKLTIFRSLAILARLACAQPGIQQNGVVNSASQIPPTLPGGAIARGALFDISGVRFGSSGHTSLAVSHGGTRVPVPAVSVSPRRIQARMPASAPLGAAS